MKFYSLDELKNEFIGTFDTDERKLFELKCRLIVELEKTQNELLNESNKDKVKKLINVIEKVI